MPLPVLLGLPWLAGLVGGLFSALFTFFASYLTKRLAIAAAAITLIAGITTAFFAALEALVAGITLVLPPGFATGAGLILPSNTSLCISIMITAKLAHYAYCWSVKVIQLKLF